MNVDDRRKKMGRDEGVGDNRGDRLDEEDCLGDEQKRRRNIGKSLEEQKSIV